MRSDSPRPRSLCYGAKYWPSRHVNYCAKYTSANRNPSETAMSPEVFEGAHENRSRSTGARGSELRNKTFAPLLRSLSAENAGISTPLHGNWLNAKQVVAVPNPAPSKQAQLETARPAKPFDRLPTRSSNAPLRSPWNGERRPRCPRRPSPRFEPRSSPTPPRSGRAADGPVALDRCDDRCHRQGSDPPHGWRRWRRGLPASYRHRTDVTHAGSEIATPHAPIPLSHLEQRRHRG